MSAASRTTLATFRSFVSAALFGGVAVLAACSSTPAPAAAACDSAKCAAGNTCLPLNGETKCRKTCSSNADPATSCPFGYTCIDTQTGAPPFCVKDAAVRDDGTPLEKKPSGQWGASCQANLGIANPGCDGDQGFLCYGISPTDGEAYCTRYDCTTDLECGAGFWCGKVNQTPNAQTAVRATIGEVQNVCLRRTYCATCQVDLDCPPILGKSQHCVGDQNGALFCAPECDTAQNCPNEATCVDVGIDAHVCYPRALVCVGDGSLCSPCRVDTDCGDDGVCVKGQYTTERSCAKKVGADCTACPKTVANPARTIGCAKKSSDRLPANYCVGLYDIGGEPTDLGCWTPNRR